MLLRFGPPEASEGCNIIIQCFSCTVELDLQLSSPRCLNQASIQCICILPGCMCQLLSLMYWHGWVEQVDRNDGSAIARLVNEYKLESIVG